MKYASVPDTLKILILYADFLSGHEVKRTFEHILNKLISDEIELDPHLEFRLWRLDLLEDPDIRKQASRDVSTVDLIVVTADEGLVCPEPFRNWAQTWPDCGDGAARALVSYRPSGGVSTESTLPSSAFLEQLAEQKGMHLIRNGVSAAPSFSKSS